MLLTCAAQTWVSKKAKDKVEQLNSKPVKNICVIKHAALGDIVHTRPMINALRKEFPDARITFGAITHYMRGIPEDLIDDIHITKGKGYSRREQFKSLRSLPPQDILFDITASSRSQWISLFTKATLKIGYKHKGAQLLAYDIAIARAHYRFEAETFAEQLNTIGLDYDWPLVYNMPKLEPVMVKPYILYFPTASTLTKAWPAENYAELLNKASGKYTQYKHILLSGVTDWEKKVAEKIKNNVNDSVELVHSIGEHTDALLCNADMLVSSDTGIRNLAIAYETPTLSIFFPFTAAVYGYRPRCGNHTIIYTKDNTPITADQVLNEYGRMLT